MKRNEYGRHVLTNLILLLGFFLVAGGCRTAPKQTHLMSTYENVKISSLELKIRTHKFEGRFSGIVEQAADEIIDQTSDQKIRERALLWKMYAIPAAQKAIFQYDPLASLVDIWALCIQMREYFIEGAGKDAFGDWQTIAVDASELLESEIIAIAKKVTRSGDISKGQDFVDFWASENPIESPLFTRRSTTELFASVMAETKFSLSSTVFTVAESIIFISNRMNSYLDFLPKQGRWQVEFLTNKLVQHEDIDTGLENFSSMAGSTERAVDMAEQVPEIIQNERIALLKEMDRQRIATLDELKNERMAILDSMQKERIAVLEALREERIETLKAFEDMTSKAIDESSAHIKELMDHFFLRVIQVLAVLVILGFVALLILRKKK